MKRLTFILLSVALAICASAKTYLITDNVLGAGTIMEYKGVQYTVGIDAFASVSELMNATPEEGSTVLVAPGTYNDAVTINVNGLTFLGCNANCESRANTRYANESTITNQWTIAANNITINGFALTGNGQMYEWNARNGAPISGFNFIYNTVSASTIAKGTEYAVLQFGHYAGSDEAQDEQWQCRYENFKVAHNTFTGSENNTANFISLNGAYGTTKIIDNKFTNGGTSIYLCNGQGTMNIRHNTFKNVGDTARLAQGTTYGEYCISMRYCGKATTEVNIQHNMFNACQGQGSMYSLIRFFNGDKNNTIMPLADTKLNVNYNIFKKKPKHSSSTYNYIYYGNADYTTNKLIVDSRFNEYDNSEYCFGTTYLPNETGKASRVFASSMGLFDFAKSAGTTMDYFASPCGTTIKNQSMKTTTVCQSFDIDETTGDMYFIQIDASNGQIGEDPQTVIRYYLKDDGTTGKQYMYLGNAGHGSNIAVCRMSDGKLYLFTGGDGKGANCNTSYSICIFPWVKGASVDLAKTSFTHNDKTYEIKKMTSGNGHNNPYPAVDKQNRLLCESSRSTNYMYFVIWDLDDAFQNLGNATPLASIKIPKKSNKYSSDSYPGWTSADQGYMTWYFQGYTISGDYIYQAEGVGEEDPSAVVHNGSRIPTIILNAYNWRTNEWAYRKPVMKSEVISLYHGEPEGWKMHRDSKGRTNMYLQIATGSSGSRKANVFEYVADVVTGDTYKIPTVTITPEATSANIEATSLDAVTTTIKLTHNFLLSGIQATISGEDADQFSVKFATTSEFGKVWDSKTNLKITYTPNANKTAHNAVLRISSLNADDILIPLQGNYTYTEPTPDPEPEPTPTVQYELNGGELPKAAEVPTNDSLWSDLRVDYKAYYGYTREGETVANVANFLYGGALHDSLNIKHMLTDATSGWQWLGNYIIGVTTKQGVALESESNWRWNMHAFFNCFDGTVQGTQKMAAADYSTAGKPTAWGPAYREVYGKAVVLPEVITETFVLPTPIREGYTFGGWYWEADFSGIIVEQLEVGANGTLYAKWNTTGGTTTDLETYHRPTLDINAPMYDILGRPVDATYRGIIIQHGNKYLLR